MNPGLQCPRMGKDLDNILPDDADWSPRRRRERLNVETSHPQVQSALEDQSIAQWLSLQAVKEWLQHCGDAIAGQVSIDVYFLS